MTTQQISGHLECDYSGPSSPHSATDNGKGLRLPFATNAAAELPLFLALA